MSSVGVRLGLEFSLKEFCGDFFSLRKQTAMYL